MVIYMEILKYLFLGLVQGFTEPIPISSSGHLVIIKNLLKMENLADLNFEIIVNFGSLLAILFLYRKMIIELVSHFFMFIKTKDDKYKKNFRYCLFIVIGTIPAGLLGLLLKDQEQLF